MSETPTLTERGAQPSFPAHFDHTTRALRGALVELLNSVGADPRRPQEIARRFGLNKNLAWKAARIARAGDGVEIVPHVPGASGLRILLEALEKGGAPATRLAQLGVAMEAYHEMVRLHAGDRTGLELLLASLHSDHIQSERLEAGRRLSFQGNSVTWGVQARLRLGVQIIAPHAGGEAQAGEGRIDIASIGGVFDFHRLRPTGSWPLVRWGTYGGDEAPNLPLDPSRPASSGPPLMPDFCRGDLPELRAVEAAGQTLYELGEGPVGQAAAVSCVFGWMQRSFASIYADEDNDVGEHYLTMDAPAEKVQFDLLLHRDLPLERAPELHVLSLMQGHLDHPYSRQAHRRLPCPEPLQDLGSAPVLATPDVPDFPALIEVACARLGRELDEFRGYRFALTYPPIPTLVTLSYPLPRK